MGMIMYPDTAPSFGYLTSIAYFAGKPWIVTTLQKVFKRLLVYNFLAYGFNGYLILCGVALTLCAVWNGIQALKM
ncbi:unnamed protein product [Orchesella dallaii]|uniref:Uncharacterized protein n=1 Tax=Orchesella dallaii TaxID=48710 RepID=A0ABP1RNB2_9HEXA